MSWTWRLWTPLLLCAAWMVIQGIMDVVQGADKGSRFYAVENILLRVLGVALVAGGVLVLFRRVPFYWLGATLLLVAAIEALFFSPFKSYSRFETIATLVVVFITLLVPAAILVLFATRSA